MGLISKKIPVYISLSLLNFVKEKEYIMKTPQEPSEQTETSSSLHVSGPFDTSTSSKFVPKRSLAEENFTAPSTTFYWLLCIHYDWLKFTTSKGGVLTVMSWLQEF